MRGNYAVFGLGSFGSKLVDELAEAGHNVVAVDIDKDRVDEFKDKVTSAIIADVSLLQTVQELDIRQFDAVILGMSSHFESMIFALVNLKQEGARNIIVKVNDTIQAKIVSRLGADEVIQPDQDVAERLSKRLTMSNVADIFEFKGAAIADVKVPASMDGKSIRELDLRNRFGLIVLLIKKPGRALETVWNPDMELFTGDELTVFGREETIKEVFEA